MHLVFVYGTLKKGLSNSYVMKNAKFIGLGITKEEYQLYKLRFPCLFETINGFQVRGEVYEVDDKLLAGLDYFEGVPDLYYRKEIEVFIEGIGLSKAFVYFSNEPIPQNQIPIKEYYENV